MRFLSFDSARLRRCGAALLGLLALSPAFADDRDLLRDNVGDPYVFIILDTSGSMAWTPPCSAEQFAAGECSQVCTDRDCFAPLNGDDRASKLYQAKEALYEVISRTDGVNFGFATYNQDQLRARAKHWVYRATSNGPVVETGGRFPAIGDEEVFGLAWTCDNGGTDGRIGCFPHNNGGTPPFYYPADLDDPWEETRAHRLPKGGIGFNTDTAIYVRSNGKVFWVNYHPKSGSLGDSTITVEIKVEKCKNPNAGSGSCDSSGERDTISGSPVDVTFQLVSDFISWDNSVNRNAEQGGYYTQGQAADAPAGNTCAGWDPNTDTANDLFSGYNARFPTTAAFTSTDPRSEGDVVPLSWTKTNADEITRRMAPNLAVNSPFPDFRVATYFANNRAGADAFLRLKSEAQRPLHAFGSTPLAGSLTSLRNWFGGCTVSGSTVTCTGGWKGLATNAAAASYDRDWLCRPKYVILLTDGDETCGGDPCSIAADLKSRFNLYTFVVGFGLEAEEGNALDCIAENGKPPVKPPGLTDAQWGEPFLPQNKDELVDVLTRLFGGLKTSNRAFASAAVPTQQANVSDKIFLSTFTPLNDRSVWQGHVDAFLRPLPLRDGKPDTSRKCSALGEDNQSRCHLWDAGEELLEQGATAEDVATDDFNLGNNVNERRVFYSLAPDPLNPAVPSARRLFEPGATAAQRQDLFDGLGLAYTITDLDSATSTPSMLALETFRETYKIKEGQTTILVDDPADTVPPIDQIEQVVDFEYLLGDIFHSNPTVIDRPADFGLFNRNLYASGVDTDGRTCNDSSPGYRCFARKHNFRRKMLAVGANDGMVHVFDAGTYDEDAKEFNNGTGRELFAYIPRMVMPIVREIANRSTQVYSVDGTIRAVDVFIDPVNSSTSAPTASERLWRSVLIGGLREGGSRNGGGTVRLQNAKKFTSGYYALDVTQPDRLDTDYTPASSDVVPSCITNYSSSACGPVPFGSALWEFTDSFDGSPAEWGYAFDEDDPDGDGVENGNGYADLGETWSVPVIGRIRVKNAAGTANEDRWVAIFGGGVDPDDKVNPKRGNWVYMVDIETGRAIYKQPVQGSIPGDVAVVDTNNDSYFDWVYFGTTAGFIYKIDLTTPQPVVDVTVTQVIPPSTTVNKTVKRVVANDWKPFKVFDTGGLPLYFSPTVVTATQIGRYVLAFGTGDREDLWTGDSNEHRFYLIVDENWTRADALDPDTTLPATEADYPLIDAEADANPDDDFLFNPDEGDGRGWVLGLAEDERVVAEAFALGGVVVFPTFRPRVDQLAPVAPDTVYKCQHRGNSRVFSVFASNADSVLAIGGESADRYFSVANALVTPPYVTKGQTDNSVSGDGSGDDDDDDEEEPGDAYDACPEDWKVNVTDRLKTLFPKGTRFSNAFYEIQFQRDDTAAVCPIPVPVGITRRDWKEF